MTRTTHTPTHDSDLVCRNFLPGCFGLFLCGLFYDAVSISDKVIYELYNICRDATFA